MKLDDELVKLKEWDAVRVPARLPAKTSTASVTGGLPSAEAKR